MLSIAFGLTILAAAPSALPDFGEASVKVRSTLEHMVAIDTSNPPGNEKALCEFAALRLRDAGIESQILESAPGRANLVVRLKGVGSARPMLIVAHMDTVGANKDEWASDPWKLTERDGHLYGRGSIDDKGMAAIAVETLILLKSSHAALTRDLILVLSADEEAGNGIGTGWLLEKHRELIDAEFAFNEGGALRSAPDGHVQYVFLQNAEKNWQNYEIVAKGPGGHSSQPLPDNSIYRLARAMAKIDGLEPAPRLTATTRAWFTGAATWESKERAKAMLAVANSKTDAPPAWAVKQLSTDPQLHAQLRSTCVPTLLTGGTRVNALPTEAMATLNCRMIPGENADAFGAQLKAAIADAGVEVRWKAGSNADVASPPAGLLVDAVTRATSAMYPHAPVVPYMSAGGTDSKSFRLAGIPSYGLDPFPMSEEDERRMHGPDERMQGDGPRIGIEFLYRVVMEAQAVAPATAQGGK
jgi:acetylornithine deacetylase/succinyl-diaminopimelate desuccinylase-like protein